MISCLCFSHQETHFTYEAIFRSVMKHLMDAATNEYLFGMDFFKDRSFDTFNQIFGRTISLLLENLENYLFSCYDAIGLLLMIKVCSSQTNLTFSNDEMNIYIYIYIYLIG
jgi:hypothetical protein